MLRISCNKHEEKMWRREKCKQLCRQPWTLIGCDDVPYSTNAKVETQGVCTQMTCHNVACLAFFRLGAILMFFWRAAKKGSCGESMCGQPTWNCGALHKNVFTLSFCVRHGTPGGKMSHLVHFRGFLLLAIISQSPRQRRRRHPFQAGSRRKT